MLHSKGTINGQEYTAQLDMCRGCAATAKGVIILSVSSHTLQDTQLCIVVMAESGITLQRRHDCLFWISSVSMVWYKTLY